MVRTLIWQVDKAREAFRGVLNYLFLYNRFEVYVTACKVCNAGISSLDIAVRRDHKDSRQTLASLADFLR